MGNEQGKLGSGEGDFADPHKSVRHEQNKSKRLGSKATETADVHPAPGHQGQRPSTDISKPGVLLSEYVNNLETYEERSSGSEKFPVNSTETQPTMQFSLNFSEQAGSNHNTVPDGSLAVPDPKLEAKEEKVEDVPTSFAAISERPLSTSFRVREDESCGAFPDTGTSMSQAQAKPEKKTTVGYDGLLNDTVADNAHVGPHTLETRKPVNAELTKVKCSLEEIDDSIHTGTIRPDLPLESLHNEKQEAVVNIQMRHSPRVSEYHSSVTLLHSVCARDVESTATGGYDNLHVVMEQKTETKTIISESGEHDMSLDGSTVTAFAIEREVKAAVEDLCAQVILQHNTHGANTEFVDDVVHTEADVGDCAYGDLIPMNHVDSKVNIGLNGDRRDCLSNDADHMDECVKVGELIIDKNCDAGSVDNEKEYPVCEDPTEVESIPLDSLGSLGSTNSLMGNKSGGMSKRDKTFKDSANRSNHRETEMTPDGEDVVPDYEHGQLGELDVLAIPPSKSESFDDDEDGPMNAVEHTTTGGKDDEISVMEQREQMQADIQQCDKTNNLTGDVPPLQPFSGSSTTEAAESSIAHDVPETCKVVDDDPSAESGSNIFDEEVISETGLVEDRLEICDVTDVTRPAISDNEQGTDEVIPPPIEARALKSKVSVKVGNVSTVDPSSLPVVNLHHNTTLDDSNVEPESSGQNDICRTASVNGGVGSEVVGSEVVEVAKERNELQDEELLEDSEHLSIASSAQDFTTSIGTSTEGKDSNESGVDKKDHGFGDDHGFAGKEEDSGEGLPEFLEDGNNSALESNLLQSDKIAPGHPNCDVVLGERQKEYDVDKNNYKVDEEHGTDKADEDKPCDFKESSDGITVAFHLEQNSDGPNSEVTEDTMSDNSKPENSQFSDGATSAVEENIVGMNNTPESHSPIQDGGDTLTEKTSALESENDSNCLTPNNDLKPEHVEDVPVVINVKEQTAVSNTMEEGATPDSSHNTSSQSGGRIPSMDTIYVQEQENRKPDTGSEQSASSDEGDLATQEEEDSKPDTEGEQFDFSDGDSLDVSDTEIEVKEESHAPNSQQEVDIAEPSVASTLEKGDNSTLDTCILHDGENLATDLVETSVVNDIEGDAASLDPNQMTHGDDQEEIALVTLATGPSDENDCDFKPGTDEEIDELGEEITQPGEETPETIAKDIPPDDNRENSTLETCILHGSEKLASDLIETSVIGGLEGANASLDPSQTAHAGGHDESALATATGPSDENDFKPSTNDEIDEKEITQPEEETPDANDVPPQEHQELELPTSHSLGGVRDDSIDGPAEESINADILGGPVAAMDAEVCMQERQLEQDDAPLEIPSTANRVTENSTAAGQAVEINTLEYTEADERLRQKALLEKGGKLLIKKQQAEKEALKWKPKNVKETSANYGGLSNSISILSRRSSDDSTSGSEMSVREIKDALAEAEEKYKQAMVQNAQLDNERQQLSYLVDQLKDSLEEQEDQLYRMKKEYKDKCQELERDKRSHEALQKKYADLQEALRQRDELIQTLMARESQEDSLKKAISDLEETLMWKNKKIEALTRHIEQYKQSEKEDYQREEQGLVMVGGNGVVGEDSDEDDQPEGGRQYALVTREAAQVLVSAGEGSLDVRLKHLAEEKQTLYDQVQRLKAELEEERRNSENLANNQPSNYAENGVADMQLLEVQREASKQISEYKFKLQKAEQEIGSYQANVSRLEAHLQRYKATSEVLEKSEDEMRAEKRKLQRDLRAALDRIEEMEMTNAHLEKRLERMKANRSAQANQT